MLIGFRFPRAESRACSGATRATLLTVTAIGRTEFVFDMERLVTASFVVVANDIVRTSDDAPGTAGTQARGDDLVKEFLPLERPTLGLGRCLSGAHRGRIYPSERGLMTSGETIGRPGLVSEDCRLWT